MPAASALARDSAFSAAVRQNWSAALWCRFFPRRGGEGGRAAPRKASGQQRQRMTWVAFLFAPPWDRLRA